MSKKPLFLPREGDLPREALIKAADEAKGRDGRVDVYFKWTYPECGERCMFAEANKLFENGECHVCGADSPVDFGGFLLTIRLKKGDV